MVPTHSSICLNLFTDMGLGSVRNEKEICTWYIFLLTKLLAIIARSEGIFHCSWRSV